MFYVNFSFNSRRFVLLFRDFFQKNFRFVKILFVASFTKIRFVTSWSFQKIWVERQMKYIHRFQRENFTLIWRFFFNSRIFTSNWRFYLIIRVFRRAIWFKAERLIECQLVSQNSKREICCARNNESSSLRIDREISCWRCAIVTKFVEDDRVSFYSLIVSTSVKFTSFVTMKIKYNVKRISRTQ